MYKDVEPEKKGKIDKVEVKRITIDPRLSLLQLLEKINEIKKKKELELIDIGFEGSLQTQHVVEKGFGKKEKLVIKQSTTGLQIPRKIIKITNSYTIEDLIDAFKELDNYLITYVHNYSLDVYPVKLTIVDKGVSPNFASMIVKFAKRRTVAKDSEVGALLKGAQYMPLDAIDLRRVEYNAKKQKYVKKERPKGIEEKFEQYDKDSRFIEADHINNYTRHLYECDFTIKTSCIVGKERKVFDKFTTIEGSSCKIIPK